MPRRLILAWLGLAVVAGVARAQIPYHKDLMPPRTALAKLGLDRHWFNVVPLYGTERVLRLSIDSDLVFVQTNLANFHVFNDETGRLLWSANLGTNTVDAQAASANDTTVFITNATSLFAIDRRTGQQIWNRSLPTMPAGPTAADADSVYVGTSAGEMLCFDAKTGRMVWHTFTRGELTSRPQPGGQVVAFASEDGKLIVSRADRLQPLWRWTAGGGKITAPLNSYGIRTLLVPSLNNNLYSVDLFTGATKWSYSTGAPIQQEALVANNDVLVVNVNGMLTSLNAESGLPNWTIDTLGGPLLGMTPTRAYLESRDGDLFIVDRATGRMLFDPRATHDRAGVNFREFQFGPTNRLNDRIYVASKSGMLICFREIALVKPVLLRDPTARPFGYIPPEGYSDAPVIPAAPIPKSADDAAAPATPPADANR